MEVLKIKRIVIGGYRQVKVSPLWRDSILAMHVIVDRDLSLVISVVHFLWVMLICRTMILSALVG